jgi:hypothetical protein
MRAVPNEILSASERHRLARRVNCDWQKKFLEHERKKIEQNQDPYLLAR